jgi:hypothetical protein
MKPISFSAHEQTGRTSVVTRAMAAGREVRDFMGRMDVVNRERL